MSIPDVKIVIEKAPDEFGKIVELRDEKNEILISISNVTRDDFQAKRIMIKVHKELLTGLLHWN